jgi:hypothetical protein
LFGILFLLQQREQFREVVQVISLCTIGVYRIARIRVQLEDCAFTILKN